MTRNRNLAAGLAAASLAAVTAGVVVAVVKYRQGHPHTQEDLEHIEQLKARLSLEESDPQSKRLAAFWRRLSERGAATPEVLRHLLNGLKQGLLDDDQVDYLEAQLDEAEGQANRHAL